MGRLVTNKTTPILFWLILVPATAAPLVSGWMALFPGPATASCPLEPPNGRGTVTVPAGHDLLVSATIAPIGISEAEDPTVQTTDYVIKLAGGSWEQTLMGKVKRGAGSVRAADTLGGEASVSSEGNTLTMLWGEDRQDRFRTGGLGHAEVWLSNWFGGAASNISVEVIPGTPPRVVLFPLLGVCCLIAIFCDARKGTDRLAGDIGVLTFASVFLAEQVTPDGGLKAVLFTLGFAVIVGGISMKTLGGLAEALFKKKD